MSASRPVYFHFDCSMQRLCTSSKCFVSPTYIIGLQFFNLLKNRPAVCVNCYVNIRNKL